MPIARHYATTTSRAIEEAGFSVHMAQILVSNFVNNITVLHGNMNFFEMPNNGQTSTQTQQ